VIYLVIKIPAFNTGSFANIYSNHKDLLLLFSAYVLAHGLMLFNKGLFWDDWVYWGKEQSTLVDLSSQWGNAYFGYYTSFIFAPPGNIFLGRCIIFLSYFVAALFLFEVLKGIKEIDPNSRFILVILFEIFPINSARIALCCSFMPIGYVLFFSGLWLMSQYESKMNILLRLSALITFFISFSILNSLIAFYALVPLYLLYKNGEQIFSPVKLFNLFKRYMDFVLLPIFFWIVRSQYLNPYGLYEGYNALAIRNLLSAPFKIVFSFFSSFLEVLIKSMMISSRSIAILALLFVFVVLVLRLKYPTNDNGYNLRLFALGFLFFAIGVFPYLAVGKFPSLDDWNSRHQLLLPLGASFILYYGFMILGEKANISSLYKNLLLSLILAMFLSINILGYADYQRDWYKQVSLIENFKASESIRNNTTILFEDHTTNLNANNRSYRFYEYGGMMISAFGDESRLGCDSKSFQNISYYKKYREFNLGAYSWDNSDSMTVAIDSGNLYLGLTALPKLMYLEHFHFERFLNLVKGAIRLTY
jgi:hypothetical protein